MFSNNSQNLQINYKKKKMKNKNKKKNKKMMKNKSKLRKFFQTLRNKFV